MQGDPQEGLFGHDGLMSQSTGMCESDPGPIGIAAGRRSCVNGDRAAVPREAVFADLRIRFRLLILLK